MMKQKIKQLFLLSFIGCTFGTFITAGAQVRQELNSGWKCKSIGESGTVSGLEISKEDYSLKDWMTATVPGTVLTTLLNNHMVPDPFYGMNNNHIPDIYDTGNARYTYWFVNTFEQQFSAKEQVWLKLRGVNYKCEVYLNGKKVNSKMHEGMHLRRKYNITSLLSPQGKNRLAILVYPPDHPGNANGGQGGDGEIARGLTAQYTAGWDWIQPVRDRNTGIWDKVFIERTVGLNLENPHIVTLVPGKRWPEGVQSPAIIRTSCEVENPLDRSVDAFLQYRLGGVLVRKPVHLEARTKKLVSLPDMELKHPRLWWPNGYGEQYLYHMDMQLVAKSGTLMDEEKLQFGVREISTQWNAHTGSRESLVNGQKIFIKGGNWIISDAMLRFSRERYDAEVRYHRDMNLNMIRIWGGAIIERPEFYEACDRYGLLVFQDFWFSGDCNGKWQDPLKKEDQWKRRTYPEDHQLLLAAAADQIKMIRNHPSLAFWCGGNEITPPEDILEPLKNKILPELDGTRYFYDYSNSNDMSHNTIGGNGDGPYGIQNPRVFWSYRTYPYNSEVGSVGIGDYASLQRFIPKENLQAPKYRGKTDSVWDYHKYIGYDQYISPYGEPKDAADFAMKAQLLNFVQYRALMEGFSAHMWDWYTGTVIWKTQNPWTALRGQMYDYYLDVNAGLYGLRKGAEPLHIMMNPLDSMVTVVNNGFSTQRDLMVQACIYDFQGELQDRIQAFTEVASSSVLRTFGINEPLKKLNAKKGGFVQLRLLNAKQNVLSENLYWMPSENGDYEGLIKMKPANLQVETERVSRTRIKVLLRNPENGAPAFFNRIALINSRTGKRILPAFYDENYITLFPGKEKTLEINFRDQTTDELGLEVYGWNLEPMQVAIGPVAERPKGSAFVRLETSKGDLVVMLYDETPNHRDMFLKAIRSGVYKEAEFNRVIPFFVSQGGDLDDTILNRESRDVSRISKRLPAEIKPFLFHKKGALGAGRDDNPAKASYFTQIYLVEGKLQDAASLDAVEKRKHRKIPEAQRKAYQTVGGLPGLDGDYTVFGEIVEGMEVAEALNRVATDQADVPVQKQKFKAVILSQEEAEKLKKRIR